MFKKIKEIDTAFRHVRAFTITVILACMVISCYAVYSSFLLARSAEDKIYVLVGGQIVQAVTAQKKDNIPVEAKDHVKNFHELFFTLDPDDKAIRDNINQALYLADNSAKRVYDDLLENDYYSGLISGNINQTIVVDSTVVDVSEYPYKFRCFATQSIVRPTTVTTRELVTEGALRSVSRSENNPHGFLIERWQTVRNSDIKTENRK